MHQAYVVSAGSLLPPHREHVVRAYEPLQLHLSALAEGDVAGARRQLLEQRRGEYLAAFGLSGDAGGEVDVLAEEVVAVLDCLARVEAHAHADRLLRRVVAPGERPLDLGGALGGSAGTPERQHKAGPPRLYPAALGV